jgi:hypothetical protein
MKHFILFGAVLVLLSQCSPVYVPNTRNAPLLTKAGEFQGAMQFGTSGIDLQGAVAVTNSLALMGNYSYGNRNTDTLYTSNRDNYHKHKFYEGAIGYYRSEDKFCFEIFLGYGRGEGTSFGSYSIFSSSKEEIVTGKYSRFFFQPSFGMNRKYIQVAFTPRFSLVDFSEFRTSTSPLKGDLEPKIFVEPAVTARFNFLDNRFFASIQIGVSTSLTDNVAFDYEPFNVSTGLGFRLGGLRWNDDKEKD